MADDVTLPGDGAVIATDDVAGRQFQLVKLAYGGDGQATQVSDETPMPARDAESASLLGRILRALLSPLGYDFSIQRYRQTAILEGGTATIGQVNISAGQTLANITNLGGIQAQLLINGQNVSAWQACVRSRIT